MIIARSRVLWLCLLGAAFACASAAPRLLSATAAAAPQSTTTAQRRKAPVRRRRARRPAAQAAPSAARIKEIQSALKREGALTAEPTGRWDAATVAAMKRYQTEQGLNPSGKIDALTLQKLGLGSEIAGKGAPVAAITPAEQNKIQ